MMEFWALSAPTVSLTLARAAKNQGTCTATAVPSTLSSTSRDSITFRLGRIGFMVRRGPVCGGSGQHSPAAASQVPPARADTQGEQPRPPGTGTP